ncbi:MAG: glycosyl hydrolase family protein [Verrucomicrobiales bacterium]|nr:glycosyl hydrolase family protein [Verrucomicrobiales bacterium]
MQRSVIVGFPKNHSANILLTGLALMALVSSGGAQDKPGWKMVWADEFNGTAVDASKWSYQVGPANVNSELEYYSNSPKNAFMDSGSLVIRALKENVGGRNYSSTKLTTQRKGDWLYGRMEVRAKLNQGKGMWPAIWMMPTDDAYGGWPSSGEMDIMELLGHQPNKVYGTIHYSANGNAQQGSSKTLASGTFADDFHVFAYEWEAGKQRWLIDDVEYFATTRGQPFDKRFYLILNVAVGGGWPGNPDGTTVFPNDMRVDYVRVYSKSNSIGIEPVRAFRGFELASNTFQDEALITNGPAASDIALRDLSGRILEQRRLDGGERHGFGGDLPKGVYFLEAVCGGQRQTAKLVKTR